MPNLVDKKDVLVNQKNSLSLKRVSIEINDKKILDEITLDLVQGEMAYLVGPNGAGKSTLLKLIMQKLPCTAGRILTKNERCAVISQNPDQSLYPSLTIEENCHIFYSKKMDQESLIQHLRLFNLSLIPLLQTPVSNLSGGQKQALVLALILLNPPDLLLLDEHTSALDPQSGKHLMEMTITTLTRFNITSLVITHNLNHIQTYPARVIGLKAGRIQLDTRSFKNSDAHTLYSVY